MKKLTLVLVLGIAMASCTHTKEEDRPKPRFQIGDVVYMKPDSLKCMIYFYGGNNYNPAYAVRYVDINGVIRETGCGWGDGLIRENSFH